ncbi:MAG TPA: M56 family metallopeptidase, partial [Cytophagaceae bacterium]
LERPIAPFSFFNYLVINKLTYSDKQLNDIITHEKVHIRQWHSIDVLLIELVHCILWINPFLFFLKKALKLNLEFIADEKVISSGVNVVNYQLTILQNSLKSNFHLANLFNSPKIKQRIEMMDTANDSNTKIYKYALVLPCLLLCNILFGSMTVRESYQPISSGSASTGITNKGTVNEKLKPFEGYYKFQFEKGKDVYIKISQRDKQLVLHELFAGNEVKFDQVAETEFYNKKQDFNLTFKKATDGNITHLLAFKYDLWTRVEMPKKTYQPISLDEAQINNIDGLYQSENTSNGVVKITVGNNKLVLAPLWKDNNFVMNTSANHFYPLSDCKFYNKEVDIDIETGFKFIKNEAGKIIMSVHPDGTIFHKIDNYTPAKEISIPNKNLKRVEGKYASKFNDGEEFIQITSKGNSLVIKELWTNGNTKVYVPESNSKFFTKDEPSTIEFNEETNGSISGAAIAYPMSKKIWKKLE